MFHNCLTAACIVAPERPCGAPLPGRWHIRASCVIDMSQGYRVTAHIPRLKGYRALVTTMIFDHFEEHPDPELCLDDAVIGDGADMRHERLRQLRIADRYHRYIFRTSASDILYPKERG
jgi:hypothetical protein